jgi:dTDP-4-dehydrorhamnose 3,5-epimerase
MMRFQPTRFADAWLIEIAPVKDERGAFARTFCEREFAAHGLEVRFVQHSLSSNTRKGTLRGMHFQRAPHEEVKLVRCVRGAIWDVILDLRPASPTYLQWQGFELNAANGLQLYIPNGFAHGFQTLEDDSEVFYLISQFYTPDAASGVRHDDPRFAIDWPLPVSVISERDRNWPDFAG